MTKSPFIIAGALIFWSWQTGLWWLGLPLALLAELPAYLNGHWELSLKERQRVADLCSIAVVLSAGYVYINQPPFGNAVIRTMQWSPVIFFPLFAIQTYSGRSGIELSVLFLSLRGNRFGGNELVNLQPIYLVLCLIGAAMQLPSNDISYYQGLGMMAVWALLPMRRQNRIPFTWLLNFSFAIAIGFSMSLGLTLLQAELEEYIIAWLADSYADDTDLYRSTTAIGDVGRLKLSEQVVLRVWPDKPLFLSPLLLRSGSFTSYANGVWVTNRVSFNALNSNALGWNLLSSNGQANNWVQIAMQLDRGKGILPLPNGNQTLQGLKGAQLIGNNFGTVQVTEGPDFAQYKVKYGAPFTQSQPQTHDLRTPAIERPILQQTIKNLGLKKLNTPQILDRLQSFFQQQFKYSLHLPTPPLGQSPLTHFLTQGRTGHCEYFATAAVLLLRQAGIPARYVHGWSVQEYSDLEQAYVARARHAHAWVLVWSNGAWQDFDSTPPLWGTLEAEKRPWWGIIQDLWGWAHYRLATQNEPGQTNNLWLIIGLIVLISLLTWRIARHGKRVARIRIATVTETTVATIFSPIEHVLSLRTRARLKGETLRNWLNNLQVKGEAGITELLALMDLYYRQRFDPVGLSVQDTKKLQHGLKTWLANYQ